MGRIPHAALAAGLLVFLSTYQVQTKANTSKTALAQLTPQAPDLKDDEEPKKITFKEGDLVCAKSNVTGGLTTAFSFPVDFPRGSCWRYEGRSGTG